MKRKLAEVSNDKDETIQPIDTTAASASDTSTHTTVDATALPENSGNGAVRRCPYLDTVNRSALDFDMSPTCSVSLSRLNVYCCLVCGKFFQGRGKNTHAYTHSLQSGHFVYVSMAVFAN
jgi:hypothetical protein